MRIYDTVIVNSAEDLDLLEARFREFEDVDAVHVIAESAADYDGSPKDLHFRDGTCYSRFAPWYGRWNHVRVEAHELPADQPPGVRKNHLREYLKSAITGVGGDIVLVGNLDEIPAARILPELDKALLPVTLEMRHCIWRPGLVHQLPWRGTVALRRENVDSVVRIRDERQPLPAIINAGTRLCLMGGEPRKVYDDGRPVREEEIDSTWPRYITGGYHPASWTGSV